jgi:hypothetical protein
MTYLGGEESITSGESFSHGLAARIPPPLILRVRRATDIAPGVQVIEDMMFRLVGAEGFED